MNETEQLNRLEALLRALADEEEGQLQLSFWEGVDREPSNRWWAVAQLADEKKVLPHGRVVAEVRRPSGQRPLAGEALPLLLAEAEKKAAERLAMIAAATARSPTEGT